MYHEKQGLPDHLKSTSTEFSTMVIVVLLQTSSHEETQRQAAVDFVIKNYFRIY